MLATTEPNPTSHSRPAGRATNQIRFCGAAIEGRVCAQAVSLYTPQSLFEKQFVSLKATNSIGVGNAHVRSEPSVPDPEGVAATVFFRVVMLGGGWSSGDTRRY
jgi:hypothetical protein